MVFFFFFGSFPTFGVKGQRGWAGVQRVKSGVPGLKSHGVELLATALRLN